MNNIDSEILENKFREYIDQGYNKRYIDQRKGNQESLRVMKATAENRAYRPITSHRRPFLAAIILFIKKVMRRCIKFYIEPIADQQTEFNTASVRLLESMLAEQDEMQNKIRELEKEIVNLKEQSSSSHIKGQMSNYSQLAEQFERLENVQ